MKYLFLLLLLIPSMQARGFTLGPYKLGMSHKEAAKIGLSDCRNLNERLIQCAGSFDNFPDLGSGTGKHEDKPIQFHSTQIWFQRETKTVAHIETTLFNVRGRQDARLTKVLEAMRVEKCDPAWHDEKSPFDEQCYALPNQSRYWSFFGQGWGRKGSGFPAHLKFVASTLGDGPKAFRERQKKEREKERTAEKLKAFSQGK